MKLPKGYCVFDNTEIEDGKQTDYEFKGVKYTVISGENYFSSIDKATQVQKEIPTEKLDGVPYIPQTPTILLRAGEYNFNNIAIYGSVTFIGENVGISPNLTEKDEKGCPKKNPLWNNNLTVLKGDFWADWIWYWVPESEKLIFDGVAFSGMRLDDARKNADKLSVVFRNILFIKQVSTMYSTWGFQPLNSGYREVLFENIRYEGVDALGSTESAFINPCSDKLTFRNSVFYKTDKYLGFTDWARKIGSVVDISARTDIVIEGCYFGDLTAEQPISTAYRLRDRNFESWDEIKGKFFRAILEYDYQDYYSYGRDGTDMYISNGTAPDLYLTVKDSVFYNASLKNNPVFSVDLYKEKTHVKFDNCKFTDDRENLSPVVELRRGESGVEFNNCKVSGFNCEQRLEQPLNPLETEDIHEEINGEEVNKQIENVYGNSKAYYGDMHMHTESGGSSDGAKTLSEWKEKMKSMKVDFVAPIDHYQIRQAYLEDFDSGVFLCGTEPEIRIVNLKSATNNNLHLGMYFPNKEVAYQTFSDFPEFNFTGSGKDGRFCSCSFTKERLNELSEYIYSRGGFLTHLHPKQIMQSSDIEDYCLGDRVFMETIYGVPESYLSSANIKLWTALISSGKKIITTAGSDSHEFCSNRCLNVVYSNNSNNESICKKIHDGTVTAGAYGIKTVIADTPMGGTVKYREGLILSVEANDLFIEEQKQNNEYELRIYTDKGLCFNRKIDKTYKITVGLKVQKRKFYRVEIYNLTKRHIEALGNPIWID